MIKIAAKSLNPNDFIGIRNGRPAINLASMPPETHYALDVFNGNVLFLPNSKKGMILTTLTGQGFWFHLVNTTPFPEALRENSNGEWVRTTFPIAMVIETGLINESEFDFKGFLLALYARQDRFLPMDLEQQERIEYDVLKEFGANLV